MTLGRGPALRIPACSWQVVITALTSETPSKGSGLSSLTARVESRLGPRDGDYSSPQNYTASRPLPIAGLQAWSKGATISHESEMLFQNQRLKPYKRRFLSPLQLHGHWLAVSDAKDARPQCFLGKTGRGWDNGRSWSLSHSAWMGCQSYRQLECKNQKVFEIRPPNNFRFLVTALFKQQLAEA